MSGEDILSDLKLGQFDILDLVMDKFNMTGSNSSKNGCFSQQIRMQPPDILKSIVQNPLGSIGVGSQSQVHHAPAIPLAARTGIPGIGSQKELAQDLIMKAKDGIQ